MSALGYEVSNDPLAGQDAVGARGDDWGRMTRKKMEEKEGQPWESDEGIDDHPQHRKEWLPRTLAHCAWSHPCRTQEPRGRPEGC